MGRFRYREHIPTETTDAPIIPTTAGFSPDMHPDTIRLSLIAIDYIKTVLCNGIIIAEGNSIELTYKEYELLRHLMINEDMVLSRDAILL